MGRRITTLKGLEKLVGGYVNVDGCKCAINYNADLEFHITREGHEYTVEKTKKAVDKFTTTHIVSGIGKGCISKDVKVFTEYDGFEVGKEYNCSVNVYTPEDNFIRTIDHFKIVYDKKRAAYYLLSDTKELNGGPCADELRDSFAYSWWLADASVEGLDDSEYVYHIMRTDNDTATVESEPVCETVEDKLDKIIELLEKVVNRFC